MLWFKNYRNYFEKLSSKTTTIIFYYHYDDLTQDWKDAITDAQKHSEKLGSPKDIICSE